MTDNAQKMLLAAAGVSAAAPAAGGYEVDYSCRFNGSTYGEDTHMTHTPGQAPESARIGSLGMWFKIGNQLTDGYILKQIWNGASGANAITMVVTSSGTIQFTMEREESPHAALISRTTTRRLRDPHAWYHFWATWDTNQVLDDSACSIYINGVQVTAFTTKTNPPEAEDSGWLNDSKAVFFGRHQTIPDTYTFDGYISQFYVQDGVTGAATDSGEFDDNGVWRPIEISLPAGFGDNGFYLDFAVPTGTGNGAGTDVSGEGNHFTDSELVVDDRVVDTPTNNLATLTPLWTGARIINGNLKAVATGAAYQWAISSIAIPDSGKWVCEFQSSNIDGPTSSKYGYVGICQMGNHAAKNSNNYIYGLNLGTGEFIKNSSVVTGEGLPLDPVPYTSLIRLEYNASTDALEFFDDGVSVHSATPGLSEHSTLHFFCAPYGSDADITATFNSLTGTPTTDFITLSTTNLAVPAIVDPSIYVQAHNYTGTGSAHTETLDAANNKHNSDLGTLDMLLLKNFATTDSPRIFAAHTEMGDDKAILLDQTGIMEDNANGVTSIGDVNAFTLGSGAAGFNDDTESFSAYCFNVARAAEAPASPAGSIASKVIVNDSAGWSMGTWEGTEANATIGHGLTTKPNFLLISSLNHGGEAPLMGFTGLGWTKGIILSGSIPLPATSTTYFQDTEPTASVFSVGSSPVVNDDDTMFFFAAYDVPGFSTWGHKYAGTGVADGPLALYGFNAEFVWLMRTPGATVWTAIDIIRDPYNQTESGVRINDNVAGATNLVDMDILSNGLKIRHSGGDVNDAGNFYIMACAKNPFGGHGGTFGAGVAPATAR